MSQNNDLISRSALLEAMPKNDEIFSFEVRRVICNVPAVDAVEVVRCKDCIFWKPRHIKLNDGSEREYLPGEDLVEVSVGINVGSKCMVDEGRGYGCDKSVFRGEYDFCSRGERKMDAEVEG